MGIFGQSTPFEADIDKATSEKNTNEDWSLIMDICDKVSTNPRNAKDCLKAIVKRMGHSDPFVVMQAITLLDACVNNCGKPFHLEIASRDFENEFRRLLGKAQPKMSLKMRQVLKSWAENYFKNDPELNLIPSLYNKLRAEGCDFSNLSDKPPKAVTKVSKDPNVVNSQQEEDDIAKAIELSLKETKGSPKVQSGGSGASSSSSSGATGAAAATNTSSAYPSLYPSFGGGAASSVAATAPANAPAAPPPEPRKVRALYDFEAAEENELTFFAGEIIHVLDDSDPNWWKGCNQRGDGLFPSNFVTADLSVDPEQLDINQQQQQHKAKQGAQFEDDAKELQLKTEAAAAAAANQRIEIDEAKIDRLLHLLHEANPEDPSQDSAEMLQLEQEVHQMGPLIDAELERVDRKHAQLTQLSSDLVDAINLYHSLMRDDRASMMGASGAAYMAGAGPMPGAAMPGLGPNAQMLYGAAGYANASAGFPPQSVAPMPSQGYGMSSLPYASQLPPVTQPQQQQPMSMPMPMQLQNGHLNGGFNVMPPQSQLGPAQQPPPPSQQQQQMYGVAPAQMLQQQQFAPQNPPAAAINGAAPPPHQTQATQHQQPPHSQTQSQSQPPAAPPQFMSPQHQQQQQQTHAAYMQVPPAANPHQQQQQQQPTYAPMPNGMPVPYMPMPVVNNNNPNGGLSGGGGGGAAGHNSNHNNNVAAIDQYSQLQQQMAAMSMLGGGGGGGAAGGVGVGVGGIGAGVALNHHQPVTQSFLVQNEPKNNIPIYQQQR